MVFIKNGTPIKTEVTGINDILASQVKIAMFDEGLFDFNIN